MSDSMNTAMWKSIPFLVSVTLLLAIFLAGILAPVIAPHDPLRGSLRERNAPPAWMEGGSATHLLGTDHLGRDVLSRLIYGARTSLLVSLAPVLVAGIVGAGLGIAAGYYGLQNRTLNIKAADLPLVLFAVLPVLLAQFIVPPALVLALTAGTGFAMLIVLTAVLPGLIFAHQVWRETLRIREEDSVRLANGPGDNPSRINIRQILPRAAIPLFILVPLMMVYAIVLEGVLSYYGAGVPPPIPAWGSMVAEGRDRLAVAWWISAFPALAVLMTVFLFSVLASQFRGRSGSGQGGSEVATPLMALPAALLTALLALGVVYSSAFPTGYIFPLAWLVGTVIAWHGYRRYRLPGSKTIFLGFALLLVGALFGSFRWLLVVMAATLTGVPMGLDFILFSPVFGLPGLADTPYERVYSWHLTPAVGLPALGGAILVAFGLWRLRREALRRRAGGG